MRKQCLNSTFILLIYFKDLIYLFVRESTDREREKQAPKGDSIPGPWDPDLS